MWQASSCSIHTALHDVFAWTNYTAHPSVTLHLTHLCRAKAEKAAAAEAAHLGTDMETNMEEAERFTLPTGVEAEAVGRGPPDLALISRRIKETVRLLDTFKVRHFFITAFCSYGCASVSTASVGIHLIKQSSSHACVHMAR